MSVRQLSEHIRALRACYDLTQEELAERSGFSRSYVGKIETQQRNLNWRAIERFSLAFGMTPAEFVAATDIFKYPEYEQVHEDGSITYYTVDLERLPRTGPGSELPRLPR